jgi:hypothetical protein
MPLKHLEHDGHEDFGKEQDHKFPTRELAEEGDILADLQEEKDAEKALEEAQEKWLHPSNEALWDEVI